MTIERSICLFVGLSVSMGSAAVEAQDATLVFDRFASAVAKVEVVEASTGAPSSVGTAFFAAPSLLLTNYHVVRDLLFQPDVYGVRLLPMDGGELSDVRLVALDPPNDLAVLRVSSVHPGPLRMALDSVPTGEVLYSIGHPGDLRTSVVEGVFNGVVEDAVAPLMHFSGSINRGMSGGPTLRASGEVVGINVSSAGNQMSFLVPAERARVLLDEAAKVDSATHDELLASANRRLDDFQTDFFGGLLAAGFPTTSIGHAIMPSAPDGKLDCSANPHEIDEERYEVIEYQCSSEDDVLLGPRGSYDLIYMEHMYLASESLSLFAFHALFNYWYSAVMQWEAPVNDDATSFQCRRRNLRDGLSAEMLVTFCTRGHLSHDGMYDLFVRSAVLGGRREGVVSTLRANPISFSNAVALTKMWLEGFSWTE